MSDIPTAPSEYRPDPGVYTIKSKLRGTNITLKGGEGTTLTAWAESTDADQQWQISALGKGEYSIISNANGYSISAVEGSRKDATAQFSPPNDPNIRWTFLAIGKYEDRNLRIINVGNKNVIDLTLGHAADGTPILVYTLNHPNSDNQLWNLVPVV